MIYSDSIVSNNIAEYMSMFAIKFLVSHEMGHLYNGHSELYLATREAIKNEKLKYKPSDDILQSSYLDLQTMEWDADCFGICRVIDEVMHMYRNNDKILSYFKEPVDLLRLVAYSIHCIFIRFRNIDTKSYKYKEHPPSLVREASIFDAIIHHLIKQYKYDCPKEVLFEKIASIESSYFKSCGENDDSSYIDYLKKFTIEARNHASQLCDNYFDKLVHLIKPRARVPVEGIDY